VLRKNGLFAKYVFVKTAFNEMKALNYAILLHLPMINTSQNMLNNASQKFEGSVFAKRYDVRCAVY